MTDGDRDFWGQADWRRRIHQLKQEFRSDTLEQRLTIPEQAKPYGTERKPKRDLHSDKPAIQKSAIASAPSHRGG